MKDIFNKLKDKTIVSLSHTEVPYEPGELIVFQTVDSYYVFHIHGGCACDPTYIQHVAGIDNLLNNKITDARCIEFKEIKPFDSDDTSEFYSFSFVTTAGHCDIEFRHDHNGYYSTDGEYLEELKTLHAIAEWMNKSKCENTLKPITKDF